MNTAEKLDYIAKTLTIASTILYLLHYIDIGSFLALVAAAAALMSTIIIHRMGKTLKSLASARKRASMHRLMGAAVEETPETAAEMLEKLLKSLLRIHRELETVAEEKMSSGASARDILTLAKARLEVIAKTKDIIIALEKISSSAEEKDLSTLLKELAEQT
ncbi:MAG: hypothetical protein QXN23_03605 [Candidatus Caldarchaeum sp.]|uniref:Uncharacterized protein n=1 Tax=Caldiarchaeum subterraneum TaxID=311458 RepID=A0A7C4E1Y4_CALS0|nr:hypothetical protein [Candidatus Caldarchaeales archaeon]MDJ0272180.1 hypothetical protein [Candidatus Caldarchaeales archaeon]